MSVPLSAQPSTSVSVCPLISPHSSYVALQNYVAWISIFWGLGAPQTTLLGSDYHGVLGRAPHERPIGSPCYRRASQGTDR